MILAISSLPVPVSPVINTAARKGATFRAHSTTPSIFGSCTTRSVDKSFPHACIVLKDRRRRSEPALYLGLQVMYRDNLGGALAQLAPFWRKPIWVAPTWHNRGPQGCRLAGGTKRVRCLSALATHVL